MSPQRPSKHGVKEGESLPPVDPSDYDPRKAPDTTPIARPDPEEPYPTEGAPYPPPINVEPPPVAASLDPTSAALGDPAFTLHVHGSNFKEDAVILWNGSPEPTTFVSDTELTTEVDMSTAQVAMPIPVCVRSYLGATSTELTFNLTEPVVEGTSRRRRP